MSTTQFHPTKAEFQSLLTMHCHSLTYGDTGKFNPINEFKGASVQHCLNWLHSQDAALKGSDCKYYHLPDGSIKILTPKRYGKRYRLLISK